MDSTGGVSQKYNKKKLILFKHILISFLFYFSENSPSIQQYLIVKIIIIIIT